MVRRNTKFIVLLVFVALVGPACGSNSKKTQRSGHSSASTSSTTTIRGGSEDDRNTVLPNTTTGNGSGARHGSTSEQPSGTATPGGPARCRAAGLSGSAQAPQRGAGQVYTRITLTNTGNTACGLQGYPGVSLVDASGHQIGDPATRDPSHGPVTVTLAPGEATSFILHTNSSVAGACGPTSASVKVYPPGDTGALTIALPLEVCGSAFSTTAVGHST